jgi:putative flippase GtrA
MSDVKQFVAFILVGTTSAVFTILLRAGLNELLPFEPSVAFSHFFGLGLAFILNRLFVFKSYSGPLLGAYIRFFLVNIASLVIATSFSSLLYRFVLPAIRVDYYNDYLAHFMGLGASAVPSYFGHRYFSFGRSREDKPA